MTAGSWVSAPARCPAVMARRDSHEQVCQWEQGECAESSGKECKEQRRETGSATFIYGDERARVCLILLRVWVRRRSWPVAQI